ncbi:MAG: transglutaminase family protein [Phycisphaerales bacterium]|nr:MAG: transglutaminase family protein [Phycisphaerales bacterium]
MLIEIRHEVRYAYTRPVFVEPQTLRLTPRRDAAQELLSFSMEIEPAATGETRTIESDGSEARVVWFDGEHDALRVVASSRVRTLRANPFDWIITEAGVSGLPASYPAEHGAALGPMLSRSGEDGEVGVWAEGISERAERSPAGFLNLLTETIHAEWVMIGREEGDPFSPERSLREKRGACRDVAMLFIEACRCQGLAARFVSGYSVHHPPETIRQELHAWTEVYLPGAGWRGYDPSLGLAVADGHVAICSAPDHRLAAPISGSYRGTGAGSTIEYDIDLAVVDEGGG